MKIYGKKLLGLIPEIESIVELAFRHGEPVTEFKTKEMCDFLMRIRDTIQEECSPEYQLAEKHRARLTDHG